MALAVWAGGRWKERAKNREEEKRERKRDRGREGDSLMTMGELGATAIFSHPRRERKLLFLVCLESHSKTRDHIWLCIAACVTC